MSLNNTKYLRPLPSSYLVPERIAARFHSVNLQSQIDSIRNDIASLCDTIELLKNVVYRLVTLYEDEHPSVVKTIEALSKAMDAKAKQHSPYI